MEEEGERERNRDRLRGRESCFCCNVMLNSNMQCSHHGNGGSSEATQRMCVRSRVRVCLHVSVRLCKGAAHQVPLEDMSSRRGCSILIRVQKKGI